MNKLECFLSRCLAYGKLLEHTSYHIFICVLENVANLMEFHIFYFHLFYFPLNWIWLSLKMEKHDRVVKRSLFAATLTCTKTILRKLSFSLKKKNLFMNNAFPYFLHCFWEKYGAYYSSNWFYYDYWRVPFRLLGRSAVDPQMYFYLYSVYNVFRDTL